jgi:hypothetical protein
MKIFAEETGKSYQTFTAFLKKLKKVGTNVNGAGRRKLSRNCHNWMILPVNNFSLPICGFGNSMSEHITTTQ